MTLLQQIEALEVEAEKRSVQALAECDRAYAEMQRAELALIVAEDKAYNWPRIEANRGL